ncbi:hypothetical protein [Pseudactinotalea suaedae]|uniref:hypothetical protein n=1 Tax=Pseudactinotalea suaedae TaxID=1524924 RepID=UPI0012E26332|nr:hypothetical protein [Pseudactinotalea suaedae]
MSAVHTVRLLDVGRAEVPGPELFWMKDFDRWYELCFQVAVVEGPQSLVLVNTGPAQDLGPMNAGWTSFLGERAAMRSRPGMFLLDQLAGLGIAPDDVTHVVLTPLQLYTISNVLAFPRAEICLSRLGWEHFHNGPALLHDARRTSIPDEILVPLVTTERHRVRLLGREDEIVPGVRSWWSLTHHRASLNLDVDTEAGVVALSDSYFWLQNVVENHPIGISESIWEAFSTYERVRRTADVVLPLYDPANFERFPGGGVA